MNNWALRALWISLPVTAGAAFADAIAPWADAPRAVAGVLLWAAWTAVLVAMLVPRPWSLTVTRLITPIGFGAAALALSTGRASTLAAVAAVVVLGATFVLGTRGEFARACAQGAAYGDEERFPLKVPPGVAFAILPVALLVIAAAGIVGPLLVADGHGVAGIAVIVLTAPPAWMAVRLAHQLSMRWVVLVPAGLVIADPLTLTDPVLFPRAHIMGLGPADPSRRPPEGACDLRLGASFGSCALLLDDDAPIIRRVRREGVTVQANLLLVTPTAAPRLLERARARRIHVRTE